MLYSLNVFAEESVPIFGPSLPNPQQFTNPQQFREFLLVKRKLSSIFPPEHNDFLKAAVTHNHIRILPTPFFSRTPPEPKQSGAICRRAFSDVVIDSFNGITTGREQNRHDEYIRYGQMLKLNTIIRGDAPTSCITSGQSKKNVSNLLCFDTPYL
ncbi:uncharacterized protein DEA37_0009884 [Paragonimus westermani]|uniref:Uncharacterized protein n=1 Tax=Paragonimus westermani TaxID=34504 RepID=A0A5J4NZ04_9TREM|nr:uncharacterized protein DEA37_0009884 [Paragonimus westermani]